jgi:hypothetical protein
VNNNRKSNLPVRQRREDVAPLEALRRLYSTTLRASILGEAIDQILLLPGLEPAG